jgi:CRISPR-associated exonuclease Cas4
MNAAGLGKTISASDVEKFGYCPLSWWLSEQMDEEGKQKLKEGTQKHEEIGKGVKQIKTKEEVGLESERSWILFSLIAIVIGINGLAIVYIIYAPSSEGQVITVLLSIISVLWVLVAAWFFYTGIKIERRIKSPTKTIDAEGIIDPPNVDWKKRTSEAKLNTFLFFLVSGILAMHGFLILLNLEPDESQLRSIIFLVLALVWLIGSSLFYYISLRKELKRGASEEGVVEKRDSGTFSESEMSVILFAVIATILASNAMTMFQNPPSDIARILFVIAILWLYGGFIFLYRALRINVRLRLIINRQFRQKKSLFSRSQKELSVLDYQEAALTYEQGVLWFAVVAMILAINAIIMNFSKNLEDEQGRLITNIFVVIVPLWLIGAFFFLYVVLISSKTAEKLRSEHGIRSGAIEYVDALDNSSKMLSSEKYGLQGRPDYILKKDEGLVPVEVKTGRTPKGPLFSHIMQLAAYCLLVEENYKSSPPYGIIKYSNIEHEIEYDEDLRKILISKMDDMRKVLKSGEAHRNHKRESKCKFCSRREICPEKLV